MIDPLKELINRTQKENETYAQFAAQLTILADATNLTEQLKKETVMHRFLLGITPHPVNRDMRKQYIAVKSKDIHELIMSATKFYRLACDCNKTSL